MLYGHDVHPDEFNNPMMATGRAAASQTQKSEATTKKSSNNRKTVDWTREETEELLQAWGPKFEELKKVSTKERGRICCEIYNKYKERFTESVRTLPQLKKRIQNLEYEFKNLKVRVKKTGEEGFKKIKQGFPYYDYLDTIIGQRDSVDPSRMQIESTATFSCSSSDSSETSRSRSSESKEVQSDDENSSSSSNSKQEKKTAVEKRKMCEKSGKSSRKVKRRREDSDSDWQERFENMWERSLEQEREGRESTQQIIRESLRSQMEQTNAIMAGFKDIFQNLLK